MTTAIVRMNTSRIEESARQDGSPLETLQVRRTTARFSPRTMIFAQGDRCAGVMYLEKGSVRLTVRSAAGRSVELSVLHEGALFGEGALAGQRRRKCTAETVSACTITNVTAAELRRQLHRHVALSDWLRAKLLARNVRIEEDIVDQIFNKSETRLARALLLLAGFDEHQLRRHALPIISRDLLAEMTGLTRAAVDRLMRSFRQRGFLERQTRENGAVQIHRSMVSLLLQP